MHPYAKVRGFIRNNLALTVILILSALLFCHRLKDCQMTMDEFFSINIAQRPLGKIWSLKPHPASFYFNTLPPLYETLLHFVWNLSKENLIWLRSLSILFNTAALFLIFLISKLLFDKKVGLIATSLAALNYSYIFYAKLIRCYSLLNLLTLASFYVFFRIARDKIPDKGHWLSLLILNILILYTFYFGVFVIVLELFLSILLFPKKRLVKIWLWLLGTFIFFIPWAGHLLRDLSKEPSVHFKISKMSNFLGALFLRFEWGVFHNTGLLLAYSAICIYFIFYAVFLLKKKENLVLPVISLLVILLTPAIIINYLTAEVFKGSVLLPLNEYVRARYSFMFIFPVFILAGLFIKNLPRYIGGTVLFILLACSLYAMCVNFRLPSQQFWPAPLASVAKEAKDFHLQNGDKAIIEIEDSFFVPVFVYYFYGAHYFRSTSVPYGGANLKLLSRSTGDNYKLTSNVAGIQGCHWLDSVDQLGDFDWLFLVYSDWLKTWWGEPFREIYARKLREKGMQDRIALVKKVSSGQFTLEIYKVNK